MGHLQERLHPHHPLDILVVGGGMAGLTAALEAAETGREVCIVEREPSLGGRVAQLRRFFPKLCPPACGLEINFRRIRDNPRVRVLTMAEVAGVRGAPGAYDVTLTLRPRHVNENCTCCGACARACETLIANEFNLGMDQRKAAYLPHDMAFPARYVISPRIKGTPDAQKVAAACKYKAVDLDEGPRTLTLRAGAIIWATGWKPYDASRIKNLGFGRCANVITNLMMERLAAPDGPTLGRIARPSDGRGPESVAFVQCAGSRDVSHLPYCSSVCCMATLKQCTYIRDQHPKARIYIFYMDLQASGMRYEKFYKAVSQDPDIVFINGKAAEIMEDPKTRDVTVKAQNSLTGENTSRTVSMAVLATGMEPTVTGIRLPANLATTDQGFFLNDFFQGGMFAAGCAARPADVSGSNQNATAVAMKAIHALARAGELARHG